MEEKSIPLPGSQAENIPLPAAPANALGKQLAEELCFSVWALLPGGMERLCSCPGACCTHSFYYSCACLML